MLKVRLSSLILLFFFLLTLSGCSYSKGDFITLSGSTAFLPLVKYAAESFMAQRPKAVVRVTGGGSFTGLYQVASGAIDIAVVNVDVPSDIADAGLKGYPLGITGLVFITHPEVGIDSLSREQLASIFTGEITNWRQVGGPDMAVNVVHCQSSSGARQVVKEKVLGGRRFTPYAVTQDSLGNVCSAVAETPGAIGYAAPFYLDDTVRKLDVNGISCTVENIESGRYPLVLYGYLYTKGEPKGVVRDFIDYITGNKFWREEYRDLGFYPVE